MLRRLVLLTAAVVLLAAAACGDGDDADDGLGAPPAGDIPAGEGGAAGFAAPPHEEDCDPDAIEPAADPGELTLVTSPPITAGDVIHWEIRLENPGDEPVTLVFASGQDGDVVLERDGEEVYRWSEDQMFTQALRCQTIDVGQAGRYQLQGQLDVEPGEYEVTATLNAQPEPVAYTETIVVEPQPGDGGG
jgi:hypothetical protein